jgi:hypothetical protein
MICFLSDGIVDINIIKGFGLICMGTECKNPGHCSEPLKVS